MRADAIPLRRAEVASAVFRVLGDPLDSEEERRKQVIEARAFALPTSPAAQSALYVARYSFGCGIRDHSHAHTRVCRYLLQSFDARIRQP